MTPDEKLRALCDSIRPLSGLLFVYVDRRDGRHEVARTDVLSVLDELDRLRDAVWNHGNEPDDGLGHCTVCYVDIDDGPHADTCPWLSEDERRKATP